MPIRQTFTEMEQCLGAVYVGLPAAVDVMAEWMAIKVLEEDNVVKVRNAESKPIYASLYDHVR